MGEGDTLLNALIGAVVTVVLSFTAISPVLGGGVAGYLQRGDRMDGARVGAISGLMATIPFLLLFSVIFGFMFSIPMMNGGMGGMGGIPVGFWLFVVIGVLGALAWNVGLSALGGYLGVYVAVETDAGGRRSAET